jgi:carboxyl-terminal processing protease
MNLIRSATLAAALALAVIPPGALAQRPGEVEPVPPSVTNEHELAYDQMEVLAEAMLYIRKHYITEKSYSNIVNGALHGMLTALDPYSAFLDREELDAMQEDTDAQFGGIGIQIGMRDGVLTIITPIEDTPGYRAGLLAGDRILAIDGHKTQGMAIPEAMLKLRGPKGSTVRLTVLGRQADEPREVQVVRDEIVVPTVKGARILRNGIGYMRIVQFSQPTAASVREKMEQLIQKGMTALILDLRNNPGGLLVSAIEVSQLFLDRGAVVVSIKGRAGEDEDKKPSFSRGAFHWNKGPMVVLIDGGSASAAEIVAGALQDHGRAVLVGDTTFGKGSVQSVIRLRPTGECALKLTTAYYYTPSGRLIHEKGIDPDIKVAVTPDAWRSAQLRRERVENPEAFTEQERAEYASATDAALARAIDLLEAVKIFKSTRIEDAQRDEKRK